MDIQSAMGLEALFCVSAMCASHMQREVNNDHLTLQAFISQLAYHLLLSIDDNKRRTKEVVLTLSKDAADVLKPFERAIPRFAPPNMCLCDYYDNFLSLGTITQTKNDYHHTGCVAYGNGADDEENDESNPIFTGETWSTTSGEC